MAAGKEQYHLEANLKSTQLNIRFRRMVHFGTYRQRENEKLHQEKMNWVKLTVACHDIKSALHNEAEVVE